MLTVDESLGTNEDGQAIVWARLGLFDGRPLRGHTGGDFGTAAVLALERTEARDEIGRILEWDFDRLIMAHGDVIETDGKQAFRSAYRWLLR